jgi:hypothetical protein
MSGSTRQFRKKLIYVIPKANMKSKKDIRKACAALQDKHGCVEVTATEEQYAVKFHGMFRDDPRKK